MFTDEHPRDFWAADSEEHSARRVRLWRAAKEAVALIRQRKLVAAASLSTTFITLFVLAATMAGAVNLTLLSTKLRSSAEVTVFLRKDATTSEKADLERWLVDEPRVASYRYVTPSEAMRDLAAQLGQDRRLLEAADGNPIPASFRIRASSAQEAHRLAAALRPRPEVFRLVFAPKAVARLASMSRLFYVTAIILSLLLAAASVTIVHNAMALAIDGRRQEIYVMGLVGAEPWFIRLPYLISGMLYGLGGAVGALLVVVGAYRAVAGQIKSALPFIPLASASQVAVVVVPLTLVFGSLFGLAGAWLSVARHLERHPSPTASDEDEPGEEELSEKAERRRRCAVRVALTTITTGALLAGAVVVRADASLLAKVSNAKRLNSSIVEGAARLETLTRQLRRGQRRLAVLRRRIAILTKRIAQVTAKKKALSGRVSDQLLAHYASDTSRQLLVLTGSRSIEDALVAGERLRFVLEDERDLFDELRATLEELARTKARLDRARRQVEALTSALARKRKLVAVRVARQKEALIRLKNEILESVGAWDGAGSDIVIYGTDEFMFPVAARHVFSDGWHDQRVGHLHQGTDVMAVQGAPLLAVVGGTVSLGNGGLGGISVKVHGVDGRTYYYAHLSGYAPDVDSGDTVEAGDLIGFVGDTGNAKGTPHLHFEIRPGGGAAINPYPILAEADLVLFEP